MGVQVFKKLTYKRVMTWLNNGCTSDKGKYILCLMSDGSFVGIISGVPVSSEFAGRLCYQALYHKGAKQVYEDLKAQIESNPKGGWTV